MVKHAEQFCEDVQLLVKSSEEHSYFEHIGEYVSKICELARVHVVCPRIYIRTVRSAMRSLKNI